MEATRNMKLNELKTRVARSDYQVDTDAVAEAIVRRLVAVAGVSPGARSPGADARAPRR